jgi:t-SNARE complex subunit (syntaxin)
MTELLPNVRNKLLLSEINHFKEISPKKEIDKKILIAKKDSIIELLSESDEFNNSALESDYVLVDCLENRKEQLSELEKELLEIKEIFADMAELVNVQQKDLDIIDHNITRAQDDIVDAELEILMAKQSDDSRKKLYAIPLVIGAVIIGLIKII